MIADSPTRHTDGIQLRWRRPEPGRHTTLCYTPCVPDLPAGAIPPRVGQTHKQTTVLTNDSDHFDSVTFRGELRETIRASIESHGRPMTAAEVHATCRSDLPGIAPSTIQRAVNDLVTKGVLEPAVTPGRSPLYNITLRPSADDARRHLADMNEALAAVHAGDQPGLSCVAFPSGLDRSLLKTQPFSVRTWNCLTAAGLFSGTDHVLVKDLIPIRQFGQTSLQDMLLVVEDYLLTCIEGAPHPYEHSPAPNSHHDTASTEIVRAPLSQLLAASSEFYGAASMADLLAPDFARLATIIGIQDKLIGIDIDALSAHHTHLSAVLLTEAKRMCNTLTSTQRTVLDRRILADPPDTLVEIGNMVGVTRERVRQIQVALITKYEQVFGRELSTISLVLRTQLGTIVREREVDSRIDGLIVDDGTQGAALARHAIKSGLQYPRITNGVCLDESACLIVDRLRRAAPAVAEDGIIDEARLKAILPDQGWEQHWTLLLECCAFYDVFGFLALRDSDRARTKAALLSIGAPATREEIAEVCGLGSAKVGSYLSGFPNVVRADKSRWGLSEWIDDKYEGIEAEIIQRIEEGGGVTTTSRLFEEIPAKFGVSAASVNTYLQKPKFKLHDNGHVTLRGTSPV